MAKTKTSGKVTPSRQQYLDIKAQHPDAIVFFRLGDFYETFDEDAEIAARVTDARSTVVRDSPGLLPEGDVLSPRL